MNLSFKKELNVILSSRFDDTEVSFVEFAQIRKEILNLESTIAGEERIAYKKLSSLLFHYTELLVYLFLPGLDYYGIYQVIAIESFVSVIINISDTVKFLGYVLCYIYFRVKNKEIRRQIERDEEKYKRVQSIIDRHNIALARRGLRWNKPRSGDWLEPYRYYLIKDESIEDRIEGYEPSNHPEVEIVHNVNTE